MLRFLYTVFDFLAGIFAIVSPVAIFHWLLKATGIPAAAPVVVALDPVFAPLNALLELIVHLPALTFQEQTIPITQGVLACILTVSFFVLNAASESLKAAEQRLDVTKQAFLHKKRLQQLKSAQQKKHQQAVENRKIYLVAQYDFEACPQGGACLETLYKKYSGKVLQSLPDAIALEFQTLEHAFKYSLEASQAITSYYATLRPLDPQPPYQVAIHAVEHEFSTADGVSRTQKLISFAGPNQVVFSNEVRGIIESLGLANSYHFQSLGMYAVNNRQQEIFRLMYQKRDGTL